MKKEKVKLPSQFQPEETVVLYGHEYPVEYVKFTDSKVYYGVNGVEVESDLVNSPANSGDEEV
jgi:hypothetical protein